MKLLDNALQQCSDVVPLAKGGQKTVLAAVHPVFGPVVIKFGEYRHATTLERITREVELLRELESRYYPRHFEFLVEPIRREFLVVEERLDAVELAAATSRFRTDNDIARLVRHLLCALDVVWHATSSIEISSRPTS